MIHGIRGTLDRRPVIWTDEMAQNWQKRSETEWDFYLNNLKIKDASVVIYQDFPSRPLPLLVHTASLARLRQHWILYDLLFADELTGEFDSSLFFVGLDKHSPGLRVVFPFLFSIVCKYYFPHSFKQTSSSVTNTTPLKQ